MSDSPFIKLLPPALLKGLGSTVKTVGNLPGSAAAFALAGLHAQLDHKLMLVICCEGAQLRPLHEMLQSLLPRTAVRIFPDWETLPYDQLSPHQDIISARLRLLAQLPSLSEGLVIAPLSALLSVLPPTEYLGAHSFSLKKGERRNLSSMRSSLTSQGYLLVDQVLSHGEFSVRGSLLDIYPMGAELPYRIDFFDDEADSIRTFDPETQRSIEEVAEISLLPAHEFPLDEEGIACFRSNYRDAFVGADLSAHIIYQAISKGAIPAGIEYYLPLFFAHCSSFFDYLPKETPVVVLGEAASAAQGFYEDAQKRAHSCAGLPDHPSLPVERLFYAPADFKDQLKGHAQAVLRRESLSTLELQKRSYYQAPCRKPPEVAFAQGSKDKGAAFTAFCADFTAQGGRILISASSEGRRQMLRELLPEALTAAHGIAPASSVEDFLTQDKPLMLTISALDEGFVLEKPLICVLTEQELLGFKPGLTRRRKSRNGSSPYSSDAVIKNLSQLMEGQVVVHIDHGIGIYRGLKTMVVGGIQGEFLVIEYQNGDLLNIPITALNRIARYSGSDNPTLSRLGSGKWDKHKRKAAEKVRDVAAELLDLYARRASREGNSYEVSPAELESFALGFGYDETPDQGEAIAATLRDLKASHPMDRLICGDVGFGKTEVALRAAFVVASSGSQVAVLVPTTILAEQHYQTFRERFSGTALKVESLSRFKSAAQQKDILEQLKGGQIDIIIGTHRLLSEGIEFKKLGLVIIDEEHRFGVKQKERLKALRAQVDLLTLTATPIPRTLNMAMEGMRELSIIATAPEHRLAIKTFVQEQRDEVVREAIMRELRRGGQVYYLHNDISTIEQRKRQLERLVPEATIGVGHGKMNERELQKVMRDFYHQRFNLLLCTTIIENGLDVPTANTVIIDRADLLGLAQLHQIRGRVGRSHHQAYAYLFTPPQALLSRDAKLRLEAISSMEELGAGFVLATHDLEIRGAGELLGEEQSGQIQQVGFALYSEMLAQAVKALKEGREPSLNELTLHECDIDLYLPVLFPETYIGDINLRLSFYKQLSLCESPAQFEDLKIELIDRFGFLPPSAENLFEISKLKKLAARLGITKIRADGTGGLIELGADHKISSSYLVELMTTCRHNEYRMSGPNTLRYQLQESEQRPRLLLLKQLLRALAAHSAVAQEVLSRS
ncbi:MAG: transcription-repair coupling factor [Succinivibrio sp.]|nr:transcription-repair coupling factor [Succinivibrio sp.]